jgi:serine phosphatase RsbU (regulator of sigma subunit)
MPNLAGIDVYGKSLPLNGLVGGDHIIYLDFNKRYDLEARIRKATESERESVVQNLIGCQRKAGIALADVSGHRITDALLALMLHQAFLLGARYELGHYGEITTRLFENLNTRFFNSSSVGKFLTLIYGEISEQGKFSFVSAAHPTPVVFSARYDQFVDICPEALVTFPPIGTMPSYEDIDRKTSHTILGFKEKYEVNEINLMGSGDILLLYSDGLSEHSKGEEPYFPQHLESILRESKGGCAQEIFEAIHKDLLQFGSPQDDISYVVVKRH